MECLAVVAPDTGIIRRIRDAVSGDAITVGDRAAVVDGLSENAGTAVAIVLDGGAGAGDCRALVRQAIARFPNVPVVVVGPLTRNGVHHAIQSGAAGFVVESQLEAALAVAVQAVRRGMIVVPCTARRAALRAALTHRERVTLALLVQGLTNRQIADRLFLAESTVKTHITSIFGKLDVGSRSEAVALALDPDEKLGIGILELVPDSVTTTPEDGAP